MKYIGIDYGTKRVGVALSDDNGKIAFPKCVVPNDNKLIDNLRDIVTNNGVAKIVLGESKNLKMQDNDIMIEIADLKKVLENELEMDVVFQPEFFTSIEAEKMRGDIGKETRNPARGINSRDMLDASAAAVILQSYLDKKK